MDINGGLHAPIEIAVTGLAVSAQAVAAAMTLLSVAEQGRAARFGNARDRRRFIVGRAGLRRCLGARLGVSPRAVEFVHAPCGKPALSSTFAASALRFNVARAGDVAVYAMARDCEIGVDVEAVPSAHAFDATEALAIGEQFFSPRELAEYRSLDARDRPLGFVNWWTRKESFVKAMGCGLSLPLASFDVTLAPGSPARLVTVDPAFGDIGNWTLHGFAPAAGLVGAVVAACVARSSPRPVGWSG